MSEEVLRRLKELRAEHGVHCLCPIPPSGSGWKWEPWHLPTCELLEKRK